MLWKDKGRHKDNTRRKSLGIIVYRQPHTMPNGAGQRKWEFRWREVGGVKLAGIAKESVEFSFTPVLLKKQLSLQTID